MLKIYWVLACFLSLSASRAYAACDDLLNKINYDTTQSHQYLQSEQINTAWLCTEQYKKDQSHKNDQVEFGFKALKIGGEGTADRIIEEQNKRCGGRFGRSYLEQLGITATRIVSPQAVDALKACYNSGQFSLNRLTSIANGFSADFRWGGAGSITITGTQIVNSDPSPAAAVKCDLSYSGRTGLRTFKLQAGTDTTLVCERRSKEESRDGATYDIFPEALVTILSERGGIAIPLIGIEQPRKPGEILQLRQQLQALKDSSAAEHSELERARESLKKRPSDVFTVYMSANGPDRHAIATGGVIWMPDRVINSCVGNWGAFVPQLYTNLCQARRADHVILWSKDGGNCGRTLFNVRCYD